MRQQRHLAGKYGTLSCSVAGGGGRGVMNQNEGAVWNEFEPARKESGFLIGQF